jgi:uncharacterized membrane protein
MNWYLIVKYLHILAVAIAVGGMFARQLVRGIAANSDDIRSVASLTQAAIRMDRILIIPWSSLILPLGVALALMMKWPIFGFLQGASQNWLLASNILLLIMLSLPPAIFIPHNRKVEPILQTALANGSVSPALRAALHERKNRLAHYAEEVIVLMIAALMVLKPF